MLKGLPLWEISEWKLIKTKALKTSFLFKNLKSLKNLEGLTETFFKGSGHTNFIRRPE